jgi:hypothetical protein
MNCKLLARKIKIKFRIISTTKKRWARGAGGERGRER